MAGGKTVRLEGESGLQRAAELLKRGGTVAFPTETVYGLGANALDATAVAKIFAAKERPAWDPVIVHVCDREMLRRVAELPLDKQGKEAEELMRIFWPGPLTLLLPRTSAVPDEVTAGRKLVGVRMPRHPIALELIRRAGVPVAAPSANRFGRTSPTTAEHVLEDLERRIDAVLDGGATEVGVESTVIGPAENGEGWIMYRPGGATKEALEKVVGGIELYRPKEVEAAPESMPSPGVGIRHYAPKAQLVLIQAVQGEQRTSTLVEVIDAISREERVGVMLPDGWNAGRATRIYCWGSWEDGEVLARRLFAALRELDEAGATVIVCPVPEMDGIGAAIRDRLEKAARKK